MERPITDRPYLTLNLSRSTSSFSFADLARDPFGDRSPLSSLHPTLSSRRSPTSPGQHSSTSHILLSRPNGPTPRRSPTEKPRGSSPSLPYAPQDVKEAVDGPSEPSRSQYESKRGLLLGVFCLAMYIDMASRSAVMAFTTDISNDLHIEYATSTWVITSYSLAFAAFLPLWGRISDLFSAKPIFYGGALLAGVFSFVSSFTPDQYSFYVFRALSGLSAAATIPSSLRLIMAVFPPEEVPKAITIFTTSGAIANATGLIIGGIFGIDRAQNQLAGWRWFFRMIALVSVLISAAAFSQCPNVPGERALALQSSKNRGHEHTQSTKVAQMDIPGCILLFSAVLLLMLGLTLGASRGWRTAAFIVPFILSWPLFIAFFGWEYRLPRHTVAGGVALVPPAFWRLPNTTLLMFVGLQVFPVWGTTQVPLLEWYQQVHHDSVILSSVRLLPMGIAAIVAGAIVTKHSARAKNGPFLAACSVVASISWLLLIFSKGALHHGGYWRWHFPAFIIGAAFGSIVLAMINIIVLQSVPPSMAGIAGALIQISYQVGISVALAIQAGLLTIRPNGVLNWANVQAAFWFEFGWALLSALLLAVFLRRPDSLLREKEIREGAAEVPRVGLRPKEVC